MSKINSTTLVFCLGAIVATGPVDAGERLEGSFNLAPHLENRLRLTRDGKLATAVDTRVRIAFIDPRPGKEIERIMHDGSYHPPPSEYAEFWTKTTIAVKNMPKAVLETALCNWDRAKKVALCSIEDDGGRFQIAAKRPAKSSPATFTLIVRPLGRYRGFRIGVDDAAGEPIEIELHLVGKNPVRMPIKLKK